MAEQLEVLMARLEDMETRLAENQEQLAAVPQLKAELAEQRQRAEQAEALAAERLAALHPEAGAEDPAAAMLPGADPVVPVVGPAEVPVVPHPPVVGAAAPPLPEPVALVMPAPPAVVYVAKDRRLPTLKGQEIGDMGLDVTEWVDDMRRHLKTRGLSGASAVQEIQEYLDGAAKRELRLRSADDQASPDRVLHILECVYGDGDTLDTLKDKFSHCIQGDRESVMDFSVRLVALTDRIGRFTDQAASDTQAELKRRFVVGVSDEFLQRQLRDILEDHPQMEFWALRDRAIRWLGSTSLPARRSAAVRAAAVIPPDSQLQALEQRLAKLEVLMTRHVELSNNVLESMANNKPAPPPVPSLGRGAFLCQC